MNELLTFTPEACWRTLFGMLVFMLPMVFVATPLTPAVNKCELLGKQSGWKGFVWQAAHFVLCTLVLTVGAVAGYHAWTYQPFQEFLTVLIQDILSM